MGLVTGGMQDWLLFGPDICWLYACPVRANFKMSGLVQVYGSREKWKHHEQNNQQNCLGIRNVTHIESTVRRCDVTFGNIYIYYSNI